MGTCSSTLIMEDCEFPCALDEQHPSFHAAQGIQDEVHPWLMVWNGVEPLPEKMGG